MRQALGVASFVLWTKFLFLMKTSKLFGPNLMMIQGILSDIGVFFMFYFVIVYVASDFIWISTNKKDALWLSDDSVNPPIHSGLHSFRYMLGLSFYGDTDWLTIQNSSVGTDWYYLFCWCFFSLLNNVVMYNLLVAVLTTTFNNFTARVESTLKYT